MLTHQYTEPPSIEHPSHSLPEDTAVSNRSYREAAQAVLAHPHQIARLSRPNQDERRMIAEVRESAIQARGVKAESIQQLFDRGRKRSKRVRDAVSREAAPRTPATLHVWDAERGSRARPALTLLPGAIQREKACKLASLSGTRPSRLGGSISRHASTRGASS
jgi:hypothetical protein